MKWKLSATSHTGRVRKHNEDALCCYKGLTAPISLSDCQDCIVPAAYEGVLIAIADGMGGQNAGEVASGEVIRFLEDFLTKNASTEKSTPKPHDLLIQAVQGASKHLYDHVANHPEVSGMGTTLVIAWVSPTHVHVAWLGDSRCYLHTPGQPLQLLTQDHTRAWEAYLRGDIRLDQVQEHPQSHILTQYLGDLAPDPEPGYVVHPIRSRQRILLCSDGLNAMVPDEQIERRLACAYRSSDCIAALEEDALAAGGLDNISIILVETIPDSQ